MVQMHQQLLVKAIGSNKSTEVTGQARGVAKLVFTFYVD